MLQDTDIDGIGYYQHDGTLVSYCCTAGMVARRMCQVENTVFMNPTLSRPYFIFDAFFPSSLDPTLPNYAILQQNQSRFEVTKTGEHILVLANCDNQLVNYYTSISGTGIFITPYGYLPGRLFNFLPFYFSMIIIFLVFIICWAIINCVYRKDVAHIQRKAHCCLSLYLL